MIRVSIANRACGRRTAWVAIALLIATPLRADAPKGQYEQAADGAVRDVRTRLVWQQSLEPHTFSEPPEAAAYCAKLQLAGGGWRLPTVKELLTLVDPTRAQPAIDTVWFPNTPEAGFLTSTPVVRGPQWTQYPNDTWVVGFKDGATFTSGGNPMLFRARCVR